jgi:ATP-dependent helicase/nuclease subunit A
MGDVCYSSGPGSGKTRTLVESFYRALEETGYDFDGVVAMTFTDKATNEMVERIGRDIRDRRPEIMAEFMGSHRIGTIHSFCLSILKNHVLIPEVIDDKMVLALRERAIDQCIDELVRAHSEDLFDNFGVEVLRTHLRGALERRYMHAFSLPEDYVASNEGALDLLVAEDIEELRRIVRDHSMEPADYPEGLFCYESLDFVGKLLLLERICRIDCSRGPFRGTGASEIKKRISDILKDSMLSSENFGSLIEYERSVLRSLAEAFERVRRIYEEIKEGRIDFDDILIRTRELLAGHPEIAASEGRRIKYLFVDEFQDVDPLQYEIISLLKRDSMSVVVFGDPKQSIYAFRGADVEIFNRIAKEYTQQSLSINHRSSPALIRFFNESTRGVFAHDAEGYLTPYQELSAERREFPSTIGFDITTKDDEPELIAERILSIVGRLEVLKDECAERAEFRDIAILVDSTTNLSELTRALSRHSIPYDISSGSGFFEASEIKALMNLLSALDDPEDDMALFGLLRSELFHLSDSEIYEISLREGESLYEKLPHEIRNEMDWWLSLVDLIPPSELVSIIIRDKSYRGILALGGRREVAIRNVDRFVGLLRSFESSGIRSMVTLLSLLGRFVEGRVREPESGMPEGNCVSIMTIHKAKGLEWPIVIVPYIYRRYRNSDEALYMRGRELGIKTNVERFSARRRESLTYMKLRNEEKARYEEERKRVLYVAMTRARDHLFFTGRLYSGRSWATEVFDRSLRITQTVKSQSVESRLHFCVDSGGRDMFLRKTYLGAPVEREHTKREIRVNFINYEPPAEKVIVDASYASALLECPMKYDLMALGINESALVRREADGRFYGSVIHRALELPTAQPRRIVEDVAMREGVELTEEIAEEGVRRIEDARSALERSELKDLMEKAESEVELFRDFGDFCIKGRADLFIPEKNMVVDYKTDVDLTQRINEYKIQLTLYSLCLNDARAYIYSVRDGTLLPVDMDRAKLLEDLGERVRDLRERKRILGEHCERCVYRLLCG